MAMTLAGGCGSGGGAGGTNCDGCGRPLLPPAPLPPPPPKPPPDARALAAAAAAAPPPAALPTSMHGAQNQSKVLGGAERPRQAAWTAVAHPEQGTRTPAGPGGGGGGERREAAEACEEEEGWWWWWCRCCCEAEKVAATAAPLPSLPPPLLPPPPSRAVRESLDAPPQAAHTSAWSLSARGVACTAAQKSLRLTPAAASQMASAGRRSLDPACSSKSEHEILPVAPLPPRGTAVAPVVPFAADIQALQWQSMRPSMVTSPVSKTGPARKAAAAEEEAFIAVAPRPPPPRPPPLPPPPLPPLPPRPNAHGEEGPPPPDPAGLPLNSTFCPARHPDLSTCRSVGALPPGHAPASRALAAPSTSASRRRTASPPSLAALRAAAAACAAREAARGTVTHPPAPTVAPLGPTTAPGGAAASADGLSGDAPKLPPPLPSGGGLLVVFLRPLIAKGPKGGEGEGALRWTTAGREGLRTKWSVVISRGAGGVRASPSAPISKWDW